MSLEILSEPVFCGAAAALALVLSTGALWASARTAQHARRKADGLLGDLSPNFALHPASKRAGVEGVFDDLVLRIDNHNRRPIRVTRIELKAPSKSGMVAYLLDGSHETLLAAGERRHTEVLMNVVVPGTPPGALQFNSSNLKLVLTGSPTSVGRRKAFVRATVQISFEILQPEPEKRMETVSVEMQVARSRA